MKPARLGVIGHVTAASVLALSLGAQGQTDQDWLPNNVANTAAVYRVGQVTIGQSSNAGYPLSVKGSTAGCVANFDNSADANNAAQLWVTANANKQAGMVFRKGSSNMWYLYSGNGQNGETFYFYTWVGSVNNIMAIHPNGNVGIGTGYYTAPAEKLEVVGNIKCQGLVINNWTVQAPDYVFDKGYRLRPLKDVETYTVQNKHLPEVPSALEMKQNGMNMVAMNMILLKKVEELTRYVIQQQKQIDELAARQAGR